MTAMNVKVRLAGDIYALDVDCVLEVLEPSALSPLPGTAPIVLGLRNLRGRILPVFDLGELLGVGAGRRIDPAERYVVVAADGARIVGLAVDDVTDVLPLSGDVDPDDEGLLLGSMRADGALLGLVDVRAVLGMLEGRGGV